MLILTRKAGESIVVQENIVINVFKIEGDAVRIGIEAPKNVSIVRKELLDSVTLSNQTSIVDHKTGGVIPSALLKALKKSSRDTEGK